MNRLLAMLFCLAICLLPASTLATETEAIHGPRIMLRNGTSSNWSGYAVETNLKTPQNYAVTGVKGTWQVPSVATDTANALSSTWVGIDGYSDNTVEQIGTDQGWYNGKPIYQAWYEMYPKMSVTTTLTVSPGDTITAEVSYVKAIDRFVLSMVNETTGKSFRTTQKARAKRQSAEWIVEAPYSGGIMRLADFDKETFANCSATINNHTGSINDFPNIPAAWQNDAITMASYGVVKAQPSSLSTDGTSFDVTWFSH